MTTMSESADQELSRALQQLSRWIEPEWVDGLQPSGDSAVYTPWAVTWMLVYQRLHGGASLEAAVARFAPIADRWSTNRRATEDRLSLNSGGYSVARSRLCVSVAEAVADRVFDSLASESPSPIPHRRAFTLDGTTTTLDSVPALRRAFPPAHNQHGVSAWPVCRLLTAHEVSSGCMIRPEIGAVFGPNAVGEVALARALLRRLPANSMLLGDRNFGTFAFTHAAKSAGHDVILRLTVKRFRAMLRAATEVRPGTWALTWKPSVADRRSNPDLPNDASVVGWMHEVVLSSTLTLHLVTTLPDDATMIARWYGHRGDVETDIRDMKRTLNLHQIHCRGVEMLHKEVAMATVAYNLVVQVRRLAAQAAKIAPRRLSFSGVRTLVNAMLLAPLLEPLTAADWRKRFDSVLRGALQRQVPSRSGRNYPRTVLYRGTAYRKRKPPDDPVI